MPGGWTLQLPVEQTEVLTRVETHLTLEAMQKRLAERDAQLKCAIAERARAEEALWEAEEQGRNLLENLSDVIYTVDKDGLLTYVSPAIESFLGYSPSDVTGRHFKEFIYEDDVVRVGQNLQEVLAGHRAVNEYRVVTKTGQVRWMRTSSQPVYENDHVVGVQGVLSDITERKQAEEARQKLTHDLGERVKELDCLYGVSKLAGRQDISLEEIYQGSVELLPRAFQYPEVTCARIAMGGKEFRTDNFRGARWKLAADLLVHGERNGTLEVYYLKERPESHEGPFLKEERHLIDAVAGQLGRITERRRAELALQVSQQFLQHALDSLSANIAILDDAGTILAVNASWRSFADANGLAWEDYGVGRSYLTAIDLASGDSIREALEATAGIRELTAGKIEQFSLEYPCHSPSEERWFFVRATRFQSDGAVRVVAAHEDITERKQAEEQTRRQNEFLTSVLESLTHPFYVIDANDYAIQIANAAARMGSLKGRATCYALTHDRTSPCTEARHPCPLEEIKRTKRPVTVEHVHHGHDGSERNVEIHGYPLFDVEGNVVRVIEYTLDITERKKAAAALRQSERKYRQLIEALHEGIWVIDQDANTTFVNPRMAEMLGYTVDEMMGEHLFSFMDERGVEISTRNLRRREQGIKEQHDFEFLRKDGSRIYTTLETAPLHDDDGNYEGAIAGVMDVTRHRRTEEALLEAKEAAEQARQEERERRREAEQRRKIAESLADVLVVLNSNQPLDGVLDFIAAQTSQLLDNQAVAIHRLQGAGEMLSIQAARGLPVEALSGVDAPPGLGALHQAMASCRPVAVRNLRSAPFEEGDLAQHAGGQGLSDPWLGLGKAVLAVPIVVKGEVYGGFLLYHAEPRDFSDDEVELATVFSDQVALAIENSRLRSQVEEAAATAERTRLARDLHDSVTQALFSASLVAEVLPQVWQRDPDEAMQGLDELRHLTRNALAEMRTMLLELRPTALTETRLDDLLRQLTEAVTGRAELHATCNAEPIPTLPAEVHVTFYRVAQEALHNMLKHAQASQVTVSLRASPPISSQLDGDWRGQVILYVRDDGQGFDPGDRVPDQLGLSFMRERAEAVGATLAINSEPGSGTEVTLIWHNA